MFAFTLGRSSSSALKLSAPMFRTTFSGCNPHENHAALAVVALLAFPVRPNRSAWLFAANNAHVASESPPSLATLDLGAVGVPRCSHQQSADRAVSLEPHDPGESTFRHGDRYIHGHGPGCGR